MLSYALLFSEWLQVLKCALCVKMLGRFLVRNQGECVYGRQAYHGLYAATSSSMEAGNVIMRLGLLGGYSVRFFPILFRNEHTLGLFHQE